MSVTLSEAAHLSVSLSDGGAAPAGADDGGVASAAFELLREVELPALQAVFSEYRHRVTGARHLHLAADNSENVFVVAFKTMPEDSTGVAHILEHTVLCGSERYPVRDPFFLMIRRSLNTFMNAFTASDWTAYPFASQNRQDFDNLLRVYLDAVFFPHLHPLDFAQEGIRIEPEQPGNPDTALVYKGVVFNEMKGAMSAAHSVLHETLNKYLYPTTTYHHNSGGEPAHIVLTFGAIDHGGVQDHAVAAPGAQGGLAGDHAAAHVLRQRAQGDVAGRDVGPGVHHRHERLGDGRIVQPGGAQHRPRRCACWAVFDRVAVHVSRSWMRGSENQGPGKTKTPAPSSGAGVSVEPGVVSRATLSRTCEAANKDYEYEHGDAGHRGAGKEGARIVRTHVDRGLGGGAGGVRDVALRHGSRETCALRNCQPSAC